MNVVFPYLVENAMLTYVPPPVPRGRANKIEVFWILTEKIVRDFLSGALHLASKL